ncbi:uncharacterized protein LOC143921528 [Arctopsyche grandis]|uniref:uncharacterized protein LOC143921528 n=1 Tax=Arctopsyche grandis TaxID=121162 RepID=UPI00406D7DC7
MPTWRDCVVCASVSRRLFKSTMMPYLARKSAPIIARGTAATMNDHGYWRRRPMFTTISCVPYVAIRDPLAARSSNCAGRLRFSGGAGRTETSAPVSMRKLIPVLWSRTKRREL